MRRNDMQKMTSAELTILRAIGEIENMGADVRLSKAQGLLRDASNLVADYLEETLCKECGGVLPMHRGACEALPEAQRELIKQQEKAAR